MLIGKGWKIMPEMNKDFKGVNPVISRKYVEENYIHKEKIREQINQIENMENASIPDIFESQKEFCIDVLKELLEDTKDV